MKTTQIVENIENVNYKKLDIIENNWQKFPWKIDYLFYILFTSNQPSDIIFGINNDNDCINSIQSKALQISNIKLNHLTISKEDVCLALNIKNINGCQSMTYKTVIFNNNILFRVQITEFTTGQLLVFRFLDTSIDIDCLFNTKIEKFIHYCLLNQKLSNKHKIQKIRKI